MALIVNCLVALIILYLLILEKLKNKRMLLGLIFIIALFGTIIHDFKKDFNVTYLYTYAQCKIVNKDIQTSQFFHLSLFYPIFHVQFNDEGQIYNSTATLNIIDPRFFSHDHATALSYPYYIGETYPCWYDPSDSNTVVFQQGWFTWADSWKITCVGLILFVLMAI